MALNRTLMKELTRCRGSRSSSRRSYDCSTEESDALHSYFEVMKEMIVRRNHNTGQTTFDTNCLAIGGRWGFGPKTRRVAEHTVSREGPKRSNFVIWVLLLAFALLLQQHHV